MTARAARPEDLLRIKSIGDVQMAPDGRRIAYQLTELDAEADEVRASIWLVAADGGEPVRLTRGPKRDTAPRWSPDGSTLAFLSDRDGGKPQLYLLPLAAGEPRKLTALDGGAGAAVWSPDGRTILFAARVSKDEPPKDTEARKRWEQRPREVTRAHYKDDGQGYTFDAVTQLFTVSADGSAAPAPITQGDGESRTPAWSPDGRRIAFIRTRTGADDYNIGDVWLCDADGGNARPLTQDIGRATLPAWSPDGTAIACFGAERQQREMGGDMLRLWRVSPAGEATCLTRDYDRTPFVTPSGPPPAPVWSPDGAAISFLVADAGNVHLARWADGGVRAVLGGERQITMSSRIPGGRIAFAASDPADPGDVYVAEADGTGERRLTDINAALRAEVLLPRAERRRFPSPNGGSIDGWLIRPVAADGPAPLLVHIHGGPHGFHGNVFKTSGFYEYVLAARGWATLALNPSGSGSYGESFMRALLGRWGEYDLPEQHAAIDALIAEGLVDPERLAVTGYSYGGYMTSWVVGHTDRFRAAIIGAPVTNLESFFGTSDIGLWFGEGEMGGTLTQNRETYRRLSPVNYVDQVTAPTLILHGEADDRCPIGQGEEFYVGLVAAGRVPCGFVRYPGGSHLFLGQGRPSHRVDYCRRVVEWVERYTTETGIRQRAAGEMAGTPGD